MVGDLDLRERDDLQEGKYWFYSTIEPSTGKLVVIGTFESRDAAAREAFSRLSNSFETFSMPTKDEASATRHAKYLHFKQFGDLERAIRRAKHKV